VLEGVDREVVVVIVDMKGMGYNNDHFDYNGLNEGDQIQEQLEDRQKYVHHMNFHEIVVLVEVDYHQYYLDNVLVD
jgi:hypothetical protein